MKNVYISSDGRGNGWRPSRQQVNSRYIKRFWTDKRSLMFRGDICSICQKHLTVCFNTVETVECINNSHKENGRKLHFSIRQLLRAYCYFNSVLLFSAHISIGKGKFLNQTGFFYKICQELLFT